MEFEWESIPQNRSLNCRQRASLVVDEVFGKTEKRNEAFVTRPSSLNILPPQKTHVPQQVIQTSTSHFRETSPIRTEPASASILNVSDSLSPIKQ